MKIPVYERCCCLFSLETGCKIIGVVQAILSLALLIYKSIVIDSQIKSQAFVVEEDKVPAGLLTTIAVIMIFVSLLQFALGILLFYSIQAEDTRIPILWVYVETTLVSAAFMLLLMFSIIVGFYADGGAGLANFFFGVLLLSPIAYLVNVVHSYHRSVQQDYDYPASAPALGY